MRSKKTEAIITHITNWNDDPAPSESVLLENLPRFNWPADATSGMKLCAKGTLSRVAIKAVVDDDHPRNDGLWVYLDGIRQNAHPISFNSGYGSYSDKVMFSTTTEKTIVMLECIDDKGCRRSILSDQR